MGKYYINDKMAVDDLEKLSPNAASSQYYEWNRELFWAFREEVQNNRSVWGRRQILEQAMETLRHTCG